MLSQESDGTRALLGTFPSSVGFRNKSPRDVLLQYADCFELKATSAVASRETGGPP